ncbi:MAG: CusA/CzcA family heavy metal efflux RND transporter, partial [Candidatus Eisenbacteria bacterium]
MDTLFRFVLRQRLLVILGTLLLVGAGIGAWSRLPIDAFPDVTSVQVMILTEAPGLAPEDVEQRITFPIELALQGLPDVREVRSLSKSALSQVSVVFADGVDIYFARQLVFQRLQAARGELPEWAEPEMGPISTGLGEIYQYTLESETLSPMELRTIQDWIVAPRLRGLPGVNEVNSFGGFVKQYHVLVRPESLRRHGLTLNEVVEAVERNNANAGGGFIEHGWEQSYVRSVGLLAGVKDIGEIVLRAKDGTPLYLEDVADIAIGHQTRQGAVTRDGEGEAVAGMAILLRGENSKTVVDRVKGAIPGIQASLPAGVEISPFYDRTALIQACIRTVRNALLQGGAFVVVVLFLFLSNARAALITAASLPLTALIAFLLMRAGGVTANLMSLGGLAIAVGMVVDASIVVVENVVRHRSLAPGSGADPRDLVRKAAREVARPILFSVLIIVIVFFPLFTLGEMEGKMFKPLALTMCFAMLGSLAVAFTIVPVLASFSRGGGGAGEPALVRAVRRPYASLLERALRRPKIVLASAGFVFLASLAALAGIGTEFLPRLDEGAIAINVVRLPSASLDGSVAVGTVMERMLLEFPEVETVVTKTGRAEISEDPMGPEQNDVFAMLRPRGEWRTGRNKEELVAEMEKALGAIPGIRLSFSQPIALRVNELISGIKSDLAIKLFGPDLELLREKANGAAVVLQGIEGAEDIKVEQVTGFSQVEIVVDRRAIARHKINVEDVNDLVETAVGGKVATTVIEGQARFAVLVRFPERARR